MTSTVERKENDSDDDIYDMLEIYEQCEYILWIINQKKQKKTGHTHVTQNRRQKSVMWTIKNKMKQNEMNNIDNTKIISIKQ